MRSIDAAAGWRGETRNDVVALEAQARVAAMRLRSGAHNRGAVRVRWRHELLPVEASLLAGCRRAVAAGPARIVAHFPVFAPDMLHLQTVAAGCRTFSPAVEDRNQVIGIDLIVASGSQ